MAQPQRVKRPLWRQQSTCHLHHTGPTTYFSKSHRLFAPLQPINCPVDHVCSLFRGIIFLLQAYLTLLYQCVFERKRLQVLDRLVLHHTMLKDTLVELSLPR